MEHKIEPIISSHLFKTFNEELQHLYSLINTHLLMMRMLLHG